MNALVLLHFLAGHFCAQIVRESKLKQNRQQLCQVLLYDEKFQSKIWMMCG